jgi:TfoX/Sxy family transcriptional regulator of competence genes
VATDASYMSYLLDQLAPLGGITQRKMFGEYALYRYGKVLAFVCDNQLFVKPTTAGQQVMREPVYGHPYPGAKPYLQATDWVDDSPALCRLLHATDEALPAPQAKPAKPKKSNPSAKPGA